MGHRTEESLRELILDWTPMLMRCRRIRRVE